MDHHLRRRNSPRPTQSTGRPAQRREKSPSPHRGFRYHRKSESPRAFLIRRNSSRRSATGRPSENSNALLQPRTPNVYRIFPPT